MTRAPFAACLVLLALAGCGGAEAPTNKEFIERADERCAEFNDVVAEYDDKLKAASGDPREQGRIQLDFADEADALGDDLEKLDAPKELEGQVEAYISGNREQIDKIREASQALEDGDTGESRTKVGQRQDEREALEAQAEDIGFEVCGNEG